MEATESVTARHCARCRRDGQRIRVHLQKIGVQRHIPSVIADALAAVISDLGTDSGQVARFVSGVERAPATVTLEHGPTSVRLA